jgi:hypothetical protein
MACLKSTISMGCGGGGVNTSFISPPVPPTVLDPPIELPPWGHIMNVRPQDAHPGMSACFYLKDGLH